jgi:hypothetical protein
MGDSKRDGDSPICERHDGGWPEPGRLSLRTRQ